MFPRVSRFVFRYTTLVILILLSIMTILQFGSESIVSSDEIVISAQIGGVDRTDTHVSMTSSDRQKVTLRDAVDAAPENKGAGSSFLSNPHSFGYLMNPTKLCSNKSLLLIIYVHTAPANIKKRQTIRQTWGDADFLKRHHSAIVFIMGTVPDKLVMDLVKMESDRYGDIVQESFVDSYRNLTYKAVAGIKWVSAFCRHAKYVLKTDDDILVNFYKFYTFIKSTVETIYGDKKLILCNQWVRMKVMRDKRSKWYIPKEDFQEDMFPPYCSGSAFLMSSDLVEGMYRVSLSTPFFWIDDYYLTGMLVRKMNATYRRYNEAYILNPGVVVEKFKNDEHNTLVFFHVHRLRTVYQIWRTLTMKEKAVSSQKEGHNTTKSRGLL